ncbi:MAG: hypothetical protein SPJ97_00145 [Bacteroides sp.]|nr:hypothetical protein [Bacteroides sp.]
MKNIFILFTILIASMSVYGQRHYDGVGAISFSGGFNVNRGNTPYGQISFNKYLGRSSYYKIGLNYMQADFAAIDSVGTRLERRSHDYFLDLSHLWTLFTDGNYVFFNLGFGGFTGIQTYKDAKNRFRYFAGAKAEMETEIFISRRIGLLVGAQQYWNPMSIHRWNTTAYAGLRILLY